MKNCKHLIIKYVAKDELFPTSGRCYECGESLRMKWELKESNKRQRTLHSRLQEIDTTGKIMMTISVLALLFCFTLSTITSFNLFELIK